jgi:heparinase II/III-like protein/alginate lyase
MGIYSMRKKTARDRICLAVLMTIACLSAAGRGSPVLGQGIVLLEREHPCLAATAEELARVRQAYRGQGPEHDVAAAYVREAERFVDDPVTFPPRGGQHNQWYQCDACETALRTLDTTHHQCPKCEKVYSGPPYDDVMFSRQHGRNLGQMHTAAWAYAISGEEKFARYSAKVLLGYAARYTQYPYHSASRETKSSWGRKAGGHLYEQTLTEAAAFARSIGPAYDLIHDSGVLSPAEHEQIRTGLLLPMLANLDKNKAGKSNWQTWHNAAMIWGGALVRDPAWIQKAIADPANGFSYQMDISVSKEGMWYENSWGYHFYTLDALVNMAETGRRLGVDLWSDERLKRMFTLPIQYTMADGMLPRFGDDVNSSVRRVAHLLEPAYHAYKAPQILPLLAEMPSFNSILLGRPIHAREEPAVLQSTVLEDAGHAILRSHGQAGLTAAMTFGPYGGFHGHYDKLSFVFYGFGTELGVDPGRARSQAYRLPIHGNWYKATISHNTVLVDRQSQRPAAGKLHLFERRSDCTVVAATCDEAYRGVDHTRYCVLTGTYLLIVDRLGSDTEHRVDWLYHNRGRRIVCDVARDPVSLAAEYPGGEYVQNAARGVTDEMVRIRFEGSDLTTYLTVAAEDGTDVTIGEGVGASVSDRIPMAMIGRRGRQVCFAAVLEPVQTSGEPRVKEVRLDGTSTDLAIAVNRGDQTDVVTISPDDRVSVVLAR